MSPGGSRSGQDHGRRRTRADERLTMKDRPVLPVGNPSLPPALPPESALVEAIRARTPARILAGRAGPSYRTATQLALRRDHAAARDAIWDEVDLEKTFDANLLSRCALFEVRTQAADKQQFLMRPD